MGFFQRFYYGKAGQADFNPEDLPKNRRELFLSMFKIRFSGLITQNLIYLVFCIPASAVCWITFLVLMSLASEAMNDATLNATLAQQIFSYLNVGMLALVPCLGSAGIGATGTMYILRNWARDQHAFGLSDIKDSIKANWKQGLVFGLLNGLVTLVCYVGWYFYRQQSAATSGFGGIMFTVLQGLMLVVLCVWWMMNMIAYPMMITYDLKLRTILRNSLILIVGRLPQSVGIWLLSLAPTIICFGVYILTGISWAILAWIVIYALIGFSFSGFLYASYANALFDKYMNPRIEGAPVNMGLRSSEYDEDEADDDDTPVNAQPGYRPTPGPGGVGEAWPPRRPDDSSSWLDAQAERNIDPKPADDKPNETSDGGDNK